jgi:sulfane dehydrogenase subunit SoxC
MPVNNKISWFRFEMQPKSCILRPSGGQQLTRRGFYEMKGIAWSGGGKVTRVEITTDGGKTWKDAQIQEPVFSKAITRFVYPWSWNGEEVMIASRATDERGTTQPTTPEMVKLWGIPAERFTVPGYYARWNIIQPWKIDREGRITNAILSI